MQWCPWHCNCNQASGQKDALQNSWSVLLEEGGLLRINTTEREGTALWRAEDENPQSWNLDINSLSGSHRAQAEP